MTMTMTMTLKGTGILVFILSFLLSGLNIYAADVPMMMNYQGNVTDATGVPVNGDGFFKFAIINEAKDTAYWTNDGTDLDLSIPDGPTSAVTIPVSEGRFVVKLGNNSLNNMTVLNPDIFDNTVIYLRVWFSVDGAIFEQFNTDMQVVSTGFAFNAQVAQVANKVLVNTVDTTMIVNNSITNEDIMDGAITVEKIDSTGLDADTLDGYDSGAFAAIAHGHNYASSDSDGGPASDLSCTSCVSSGEINSTGLDADTLDGNDSSDFADSGHTHANDGDWTVSGTNIVSTVSGNVGIGVSTPTEKLDVNGTVRGTAFQYITEKTEYLQLAGGQCVYPTGTPAGFARNVFLCLLGDGIANTAPAYWTVNVPNGATIRGMRVRLFTSVATTTCTLRSGTELNGGTEITSVIETAAAGVTNIWHFAPESTITHVVDTSSNAYGIECSNSDSGGAANTGIGSIRIRYTMSGPG